MNSEVWIDEISSFAHASDDTLLIVQTNPDWFAEENRDALMAVEYALAALCVDPLRQFNVYRLVPHTLPPGSNEHAGSSARNYDAWLAVASTWLRFVSPPATVLTQRAIGTLEQVDRLVAADESSLDAPDARLLQLMRDGREMTPVREVDYDLGTEASDSIDDLLC